VPTVPTPGKAHVSDYADESTTWNKNPEAVPPNLIQLVVKLLVVGDQPELVHMGGIFLQGPVRR
jgi:hypothetical protein